MEINQEVMNKFFNKMLDKTFEEIEDKKEKRQLNFKKVCVLSSVIFSNAVVGDLIYKEKNSIVVENARVLSGHSEIILEFITGICEGINSIIIGSNMGKVEISGNYLMFEISEKALEVIDRIDKFKTGGKDE